MYLNRTFFALAFASALWVFTAVWGNSGLRIDPNSKPPATGTLDDHGLTIDPNG